MLPRLLALVTDARDRLLAPLVQATPEHRRGWIHAQRTYGEVMADAVVRVMGSWRFIGWQSLVVLIWITLNLLTVVLRWDPYPFILLNLAFSTQAAYASPLILMASNRAATKAAARDNHEAEEVDAMWSLLQQIATEQGRQGRAIRELTTQVRKMMRAGTSSAVSQPATTRPVLTVPKEQSS